MSGIYRPRPAPIFGAIKPHHDRGVLARPIATPGGERFEAVVARVHIDGDALIYADGPELRDRAELEKIVAQLVGKPIVLGHPDKMIAEGARPKIVGRVVGARVDGDHAIGVLSIDDADARAAIRAGIREVSLGYYARTDSSRHQRGTVVDHVSIEKRGRCTGVGGTCAIRVDSATAHRDCGGACSCGTATMPARFDATSPDAVRRLTLARAVMDARRYADIPTVAEDDVDWMIAEVVRLDGSYDFTSRSARHGIYASIMLATAVERAEKKYVAAVAKRDGDEKHRADIEARLLSKESYV